MSLEGDLTQAGMFVNSAWEIRRGHWRVTLRDRADNAGFELIGPAEGATFEEAVRKAMFGSPAKKDWKADQPRTAQQADPGLLL